MKLPKFLYFLFTISLFTISIFLEASKNKFEEYFRKQKIKTEHFLIDCNRLSWVCSNRPYSANWFTSNECQSDREPRGSIANCNGEQSERYASDHKRRCERRRDHRTQRNAQQQREPESGQSKPIAGCSWPPLSCAIFQNRAGLCANRTMVSEDR